MVKVTAASRITAPVKVCEPEVVMEPARVEVPLTTKVEDPTVLIIELPLVITRLATVKAFCKSRLAVFAKLKLLLVEPSVPLPATTTVPALIVVLPL